MDSSVSTPMLIKSKYPSEKSSGGPLLSMNNHDSEESMSLGSPLGGSYSVDCTPLVKVTSSKINQLSGLQ